MNFQLSIRFLLLFSILKSFANPIVVTEKNLDHYIGKSISSYTTDHEIHPDSILQYSDKFTKSNSDVPNLGITNKYHWAKFNLVNNSTSKKLYLQSDYSAITFMDLYVLNKGQLILIDKYGKADINYKEQPSANLITIPLNINIGDTTTLYIKANSRLGAVLPFRIQNTETLIKSFFRSSLFGGLFLGAITIMLIYNLFLFIQLKDHNYLRYVIYVFGIITYLASFKGYIPYFIDLPLFIRLNLTFYLCIYTVVTGVIFGYYFLRNDTETPWSKYVFWFILFLEVIASLAYLYSPQLGFKIFYISALTVILYLASYALIMIRKGFEPAKYYALGQFMMLFALSLSILRVFDVVPFTFITFHMTELGTLFDVTIFSVALASHIKTLIEEKEQSKLSAYESELKYLETVKDHQVNLEEEVEKQTLALHKANKELQRQALSSQINPHFIFNVLNSIQSYLLNENYDKAEMYLAKFSKLIRFYLTSSAKKFIPVHDEVEAIKSYLTIEQSRTEDSFNFEILISEDINKYTTEIPSLVILPFLENAVWHGVVNKSIKGNIIIQILKNGNALDVSIIDDGVGINKTKLNQKYIDKNSLGIKITREKISLLNEIYDSLNLFSITDLSTLNDSKTGTEVNFTVPFQIR